MTIQCTANEEWEEIVVLLFMIHGFIVGMEIGMIRSDGEIEWKIN